MESLGGDPLNVFSFFSISPVFLSVIIHAHADIHVLISPGSIDEVKEELQEASDENQRLRAEQQALQAEIERCKQMAQP